MHGNEHTCVFKVVCEVSYEVCSLRVLFKQVSSRIIAKDLVGSACFLMLY